jgi:hypothetical protein
MSTCKTCGETIEPGTLHACRAPSLHAPWLQDMLDAANKPLLDELARIRQLLEGQQQPTSRKPLTKAQTRETR